MTIQKFEDIIAWQRAQDQAVLIYKHFSKLSDYSFKDQICKAAVSVSNNIAEGFDRKGDKELTRFLYIALGNRLMINMQHSRIAMRLCYS